MAIGGRYWNPEFGQGFERVGHQSLAAGFVDSGCASFDDHALQAPLLQGNRSCQASRSASDDQDIGLRVHGVFQSIRLYFP